ncbi:four helix bundle protein [Paludibacter jiangxiensis]|uniref:Four helix bundle protein n=2 Tax=Paludibacter jiangxiensis TaxID=681398 RepID=A0A170ZPD4_9BACT|nr:four helix bundle protein [Paludibacter jiangxiensis]
MGTGDFYDKYCERTMNFAVAIVSFYSNHCKYKDETRIIGKQLLRSGTSVAANFRAVTRGRSSAESYAKLCIVIEETDETLFWLELLKKAALIDVSQIEQLITEVTELLKIFSTTRKNWKR